MDVLKMSSPGSIKILKKEEKEKKKTQTTHSWPRKWEQRESEITQVLSFYHLTLQMVMKFCCSSWAFQAALAWRDNTTTYLDILEVWVSQWAQTSLGFTVDLTSKQQTDKTKTSRSWGKSAVCQHERALNSSLGLVRAARPCCLGLSPLTHRSGPHQLGSRSRPHHCSEAAEAGTCSCSHRGRSRGDNWHPVHFREWLGAEGEKYDSWKG